MLRLRFSTVLVLISCVQLHSAGWAGVRTWDAGGDGVSWEDRCNWSGNEGFPSACLGEQPFGGDDAVIPAGTIPFPRRNAALFDVNTLQVGASAGVEMFGALSVHGSVTNNGTIDFGLTAGQLNIGSFNANNTLLQGGGEVILGNSSANPARLQGASFVSSNVTHAAGHTIRGEGLVTGKWINDGLFLAEERSGDSTATLQINGIMTNHGMIRSSTTGSIHFLSANVTNGPLGQILADTQPILVGSSTITGGTLAATNGGKYVFTGNPVTLSGVTINSDFDVITTNGTLAVGGTGIVNNGTMTFDNLGVADGRLFVDNGATLGGTGTVILNREGIGTKINGGTFTNGAAHTIRGAGLIQAVFTNNGTILAEPRIGSLLRVLAGTSTNNGLLQANNAATLRIEQETTLSQSAAGRIRAANGGRVELRNNATIIGGKLQTEGTGLIVVESGHANIFTDVTNEGNFHMLPAAITRVRGSSLTNDGTITVNPNGVAGGQTRLEFGSNVTIQGTGMIVLDQDNYGARITNLAGSEIITQAAGHTIRGAGVIDNVFGSGMFVNHGRLEGVSAAEPLAIYSNLSGDGTLKDVSIFGGLPKRHILGDVGTTAVVHAEGVYEIGDRISLLVDLGGTTPGIGYDQLNSTGPISLSSVGFPTQLEASIINGFVPAAGDQFTVLTTTDTLSGTFGTVALPALIPHFSLTWKPVQYTAQSVVLEVDSVSPFVADGDFNNDGLYNCADVDALVADIVGGGNGPLYDLTADGLVNRADLTDWLAEAGNVNLPSHNAYLEGDASLDGAVDGSDFIIWNSHKFTSVAAWCSGDFNADGFVDGSDFIIWNSNKFTSADAITTVPEPGSTISVLAVIALIRGRRSW